MKIKRSSSGFTMMEMIITVALIAIIAGVAFVAVQSHQRSMKQLELDKTAREIFIAAQNHLTMAESMGRLEKFSQTKESATQAEQTANDAKVGYLKSYDFTNKEDKTEHRTANFFFVAPQDSGQADTKLTNDTVLREMLPRFSLDDTVRAGGSYIIEYDLNTAKVLSVFYSDLSKPLSDHKFVESDFEDLYSKYYGSGTEVGGERKSGYGDNKAILGWYGGDDLEGIDLAKLYTPDIEVINAECLAVKVKLSNTAIYHMIQKEDTGAKLRVVMKGLTSGAKKEVFEGEVSNSIGWTGTEIDATNTYRYKTIILDDITNPNGKQFKKQWCQESSDPTDKPFIPGEDIELYAVVYSNKRLSNLAESAHKQTNSLFAEVKTIGGVKTATISNIRHLENIDKTISGYDPEKLKDESGIANGPKSFVQIADLQWAGDGSRASTAFRDKVYYNEARGYAGYTSPSEVRVYKLDNTPTNPGTFAPVNPDFAITYAGETVADRVKQISNVIVDANAHAGIFGTIPTNSTVSNLELLDCSVKATGEGNDAGVLAGQAKDNVRIQNILVHDTVGANPSKVTSQSVAGGLVGTVQATGTSTPTIESCAAAVIVEATGANAVAGGLVGKADGNVRIVNSYAGGHTKEGFYDSDNKNVTATASTGTASAGGLVGTSAGATIEKCYATTSVSSSNTAGGLVGTASGTIKNCYATGLVPKPEEGKNFGTFVGSASSVTYEGDTYYSIVNPEVSAVGNAASGETPSGVTAFDENIDTYKAYIAGHESPVGTPYDATLSTRYNKVYPFKTVAEISSEPIGSMPSITKSHVGDWPAMDTLVVNTRT